MRVYQDPLLDNSPGYIYAPYIPPMTTSAPYIPLMTTPIFTFTSFTIWGIKDDELCDPNTPGVTPIVIINDAPIYYDIESDRCKRFVGDNRKAGGRLAGVHKKIKKWLEEGNCVVAPPDSPVHSILRFNSSRNNG